jgi:hypothetical protein
MQLILTKNYHLQINDRIITQYDNFLSLNKMVQTIFMLIPLGIFNMAQKIESTSLNKMMFSCGTIYCLVTKSILNNNTEYYFGNKLKFTFSQFQIEDSTLKNSLYNKLLEIFSCVADFNYLLNYIITSVCGINSF